MYLKKNEVVFITNKTSYIPIVTFVIKNNRNLNLILKISPKKLRTSFQKKGTSHFIIRYFRQHVCTC
ncbi:MAG: hypothetical protein CMP52_01400 [Flavobacteriales bacterium]|nr:hypothetical protein [Candidatus Arcticimaribacter sp.]